MSEENKPPLPKKSGIDPSETDAPPTSVMKFEFRLSRMTDADIAKLSETEKENIKKEYNERVETLMSWENPSPDKARAKKQRDGLIKDLTTEYSRVMLGKQPEEGGKRKTRRRKHRKSRRKTRHRR